jgi:hypothetical protein
MINTPNSCEQYLGKRSVLDRLLEHPGFQNSISLEVKLPNAHADDADDSLSPTKYRNVIRKKQEIFNVRREAPNVKTEESETPRKSSLSTDDDSTPEPTLAKNLGKKRANWAAMNMYFHIFVAYNFNHVSITQELESHKGKPRSRKSRARDREIQRKDRQCPEFYNKLMLYVEKKKQQIRNNYDPLFESREINADQIYFDEAKESWRLRNPTGFPELDGEALDESIRTKRSTLYTRFDKREGNTPLFARSAQAARNQGLISFSESAGVEVVPEEDEEILRSYLQQKFGKQFNKHMPMLKTEKVRDPNYNMRESLELSGQYLAELYLLQTEQKAFIEQHLKNEKQPGVADHSTHRQTTVKIAALELDALTISNPQAFQDIQAFKQCCSQIIGVEELAITDIRVLKDRLVKTFNQLDKTIKLSFMEDLLEAIERLILTCRFELCIANIFVLLVRKGDITGNKYINPNLPQL